MFTTPPLLGFIHVLPASMPTLLEAPAASIPHRWSSAPSRDDDSGGTPLIHHPQENPRRVWPVLPICTPVFFLPFRTVGRRRFSVVVFCFLWRGCESGGLNLASVVWLINSRCLTGFFFFKEDKTAVHCSADVLVSLSKYVARGEDGAGHKQKLQKFP